MLFWREQLEEREEGALAPYAVRSKDAGRAHKEEPPSNRTHFQRDWNRITHSEAFRKLEMKTQVLPFHERTDVSRSRLTHTMEVSQIACSMARSLGANEDLTQAIAMAHDLGHAPFGHAGEEELDELLLSLKVKTGFNHNVQSLKVVELLEKRFDSFRGLNLTDEVRDGIVRHKTSYDETLETRVPGKNGSLEAQLVSLADMIAFLTADLEDAMRIGYLSVADLSGAGLALWETAWDRVTGEPARREPSKEELLRITGVLISELVHDATDTTNRRLDETGADSPAAVRAEDSDIAAFSPQMLEKVVALEGFLLARFYRQHQVHTMTRKGRKVIRELFNAYLCDEYLRPPNVRELISLGEQIET
ncbi:MAG TPA: HD domain-containing protein, partial [Alphaproteobacteria bacterium]|nr:HD domain-containing protein [Alphaproteobacteria bacterium]